MATKEFSGGLSELFGESSNREQAQATSTTQDTAPDTTSAETATPEEEEDLINSVDDEELKEALKQRRLKGNGRPRKGDTSKKASEGYERACMIVNTEKYAKIRAISMMETLPIKDVVEAAMELAIEAYERKNGVIKLNPEKGDATKLFK